MVMHLESEDLGIETSWQVLAPEIFVIPSIEVDLETEVETGCMDYEIPDTI